MPRDVFGQTSPVDAEVALAEPSPADEAEFIAAVRASKQTLHPWVDPADTSERFAAYLARAAREEHACYLVRHVTCGCLAGFVNIGNIVYGALRSGYLGYGGFASHAGRGLMTAGVGAVVSVGFGPLGLHRLEANIQPDNARSIAMVARLGFRREGFSPRYLMVDGQWRDHERWTVLAEDWPEVAGGQA
jgi:[ribosomal protein S5]-alanine N-acetyltransferase